jgi:uroporphyrinogen decarboxylase
MNMVTSTETPRQRVRAALAHEAPERVPFAWNFGPTPEMTQVMTSYFEERGIDWSTLRPIVDDIRQFRPDYIGPELPPNTDIWGVVRKSQSYGTGSYDEIAHYPLAGVEDPAVVASYRWPDPGVYDYEHLRDKVLGADPEGYGARKLSIPVCGNPFEIYCWMTGLEEALTNLLLNPDVVHAAMAEITAFFSATLERSLAEVADLMDILYFADDLGGQQNLLISTRTYRRVLKPYHARLFQLGKRLAPQASVMFHSDGAVFDMIPELMDAGIDVLEAVQTDAAGMAPERLKAAYGDALAFHGGIPVQSLLPHGDAATVAQGCRHLVQVLGEGGGYVAAPTHAVQVGTPPETVVAMLRAVLGEEDYTAALGAARL